MIEKHQTTEYNKNLEYINSEISSFKNGLTNLLTKCINTYDNNMITHFVHVYTKQIQSHLEKLTQEDRDKFNNEISRIEEQIRINPNTALYETLTDMDTNSTL